MNENESGPISLKDFSEHLNWELKDNDPKLGSLQLVLDAAVAVVTSRCGPLGPTTSTLRSRASGRSLVLPATHLAEIVQIRDPHGRTTTHDPAASNLLAGIVVVRHSSGEGYWEVDVKVEGNGVPPDLRLAVLIIGSHLWETQRGRAGRSTSFAGSENSDTQAVPRGFAVPTRAVELMRDYLLPVFA